MGVYLNSKKAYTLYRNEVMDRYFVDKSDLLAELAPLAEQGNQYVCITRPRRFGKTVAANMIGAYFGRGRDSRGLFEPLAIGRWEFFARHLNAYNVIQISFNEAPKDCRAYGQYMNRIHRRLARDICQAYPDIPFDEGEAIWDMLGELYEAEEEARFIFVLDEWDYIFHQSYVTEEEKKAYLDFLNNLLKDKPYVRLAYMTGILPIAKYSSGSELNMFLEYTMASEAAYNRYFGFTEAEVDALFGTYCLTTEDPVVTRENLRLWYNGYHTLSGERVYNPRSVVAALKNNNLGNYWTSAGPYDEITWYIEKNVDDVRDDLARMAAGQPVPARIREYAATSMSLRTRDEIFSAMVVYGFLSYEGGFVSIPNQELMGKFADMLCKEPSLGYVYRLARESDRMLEATLASDTKTMCEILEYAHDTEIPLLSYNNEADLTAVVNLVYLSARDYYRVEREDKAGKGYVDFIFYPQRQGAEALILELKVDAAPETAVRQIREKGYALRLKGKLAEAQNGGSRILAVGIGYDRKSKRHACKVEEL